MFATSSELCRSGTTLTSIPSPAILKPFAAYIPYRGWRWFQINAIKPGFILHCVHGNNGQPLVNQSVTNMNIFICVSITQIERQNVVLRSGRGRGSCDQMCSKVSNIT